MIKALDSRVSDQHTKEVEKCNNMPYRFEDNAAKAMYDEDDRTIGLHLHVNIFLGC
jgi:hypothetical protein